jgi:inner membrane protein
MFNSTHTLVGLGLARSGLDEWAPHAIWTAVIAANLPDIDGISAFSGTANYLTFHRGITHGAIGILALSLILAAIMQTIAGNFRTHFAVALIAMLTHPALDFANTYGIRPLAPFNGRWIYGDFMFVIDPWLDLLLMGMLIVSACLPRNRKRVASLGLMLAALYIGGRIELRDIARRQLEDFGRRVDGYMTSAVSPQMLSPFAFTGVVETNDAVFNVDANVFGGVGPELARIWKSPESAAVVAARNTPAAKALLSFARFPVIQEQAMSYGRRVEFIDFRFYRPGSSEGLAAVVDLDSSMNVVHERIGFNQPAPASSTDVRP